MGHIVGTESSGVDPLSWTLHSGEGPRGRSPQWVVRISIPRSSDGKPANWSVEGIDHSARSLQIWVYPDQALNNWMQAENRAKVRAKDPNALTESELAELKRLRKENADLKTDREILYKAAAFFARETDR